jgi:hypothetical protein
MGSRPAANPRYLKSGQLASLFWVVCFLLLIEVFFEERVFVGFESSVMIVAFLVDDISYNPCFLFLWNDKF